MLARGKGVPYCKMCHLLLSLEAFEFCIMIISCLNEEGSRRTDSYLSTTVLCYVLSSAGTQLRSQQRISISRTVLIHKKFRQQIQISSLKLSIMFQIFE